MVLVHGFVVLGADLPFPCVALAHPRQFLTKSEVWKSDFELFITSLSRPESPDLSRPESPDQTGVSGPHRPESPDFLPTLPPFSFWLFPLLFGSSFQVLVVDDRFRNINKTPTSSPRELSKPLTPNRPQVRDHTISPHRYNLFFP